MFCCQGRDIDKEQCRTRSSNEALKSRTGIFSDNRQETSLRTHGTHHKKQTTAALTVIPKRITPDTANAPNRCMMIFVLAWIKLCTTLTPTYAHARVTVNPSEASRNVSARATA